jgi:branched-chain amino acid transport system substrate-binding protein
VRNDVRLYVIIRPETVYRNPRKEKQVKKKVFFSLIALTLAALVALPLFGACAKPAAPAKDKIVIGQAVSLSGTNFIIHGPGAMVPQTLWIEGVNANGGIYLKDYGKKLPLEWIQYDDKSDQGTMTRLLEKLILEDKVDLILPPCSTSWLFAAAPIANKYGYVLLGAEGGAESLEPLVKDLPYVFLVLNYSNTQIPLLADQFKEWGVKTAAITFLEDLHGVEYSNRALAEFLPRGIQVPVLKSHPFEIQDMSPILKEAQAANVDAFCSMSYPGQNVLVTKQAIELGYSPKVFFETVGPFALWFRDIFGGSTIEGLLGGGAWNRKSSPAAAEFYDACIARFGEEGIDMWGNLYYWGSLQFFQQAIEKAGNLDQKKIRDIVATSKFDTALGPTWFDEKQRLAKECHPGEIGQWINGEWEVVLPKEKATATIEFPKPPWPTK